MKEESQKRDKKMEEGSQHIVGTERTPNPNNPEDKQSPKEKGLTANPGDRIDGQHQTVEEKAEQVAVDVPDITGDQIKVPTYFVVEYPDGEEKALHHIKDAEEISDVIRQARVDEDGNRVW